MSVVILVFRTSSHQPDQGAETEPAQPPQAEQRTDERLQWFKHPVQKRHQDRCENQQRDQGQACNSDGITAPRRSRCHSPGPCQMITVLACPDGAGQGSGPRQGRSGK